MTFKPVYALSMAGVAAAALAIPSAALAQTDLGDLPPEYRTGPAVADYSETITDVDGVETITRTRRIERRAPHAGDYGEHAAHDGYYAQPHGHSYTTYAHSGYAPAASVFSREDWIAECEDRTNGRGDREKGGIIGGLLGAIAGGIIGNRVADGERLGGTLIGIGTGGIAGVLLGSLIGGGRNDRGDYDCEAALDSYLSQYGYPGAAPVTRVAARTIPAPAYPAYAPPPPPPAYGYGYGYRGYSYAPSYSYSYAPPQQVVYVPVRYEQRQRVIVRETVREEVIPGATRTIPEPTPAPRPVPQPQPQPQPQPEPRYIKNY